MISKLFFRIFLSTVLFSLFIFSSCDDDNEINDASDPNISNLTTTISSAPGLEFVFEGSITDDNGIESININYDKWYLDKYITLDDHLKEYNLNYKFLVPADEEPNSSHTLKVSAMDIAGNITTYDVVVTLDYDTTKPQVTFTSPISGSSSTVGDSVELNIDFSDNKMLDSVIVINEILGYEVKLKMPDNTLNYNFTDSIEIPLTGISGAVEFTAIGIDKTGNETTTYTTVLIGEKDEIYNMYAVGSSTWYDWDPSKATEMWKNPENEDWFVVEFYYTVGNGIKFIGQLDWEPNNWGTDPNDSSRIINSQSSGTIEFDEDGYYHVEFNPYTLEYTYEKMEIDVEIKENMYLMGNGFAGYDLDWNPADAIPMEKDSNGNPYVFTINIEITEDTSLKFIGQTDGWEPFDCGFEVGGETILPVNYVKCKAGDGSQDLKFKDQAGTYTITFDYFLLRATIHEYN
ncbi:SusF/SusE family outer membrane protein [Lutibacter sp. A80]|uniref:SusF/SusE family outer membrane protein n=1 Tax=Lutibacter sp. A80 TaxID=2918453 RepID=UPI001F061BEB|nr:SusF/SusE family outer membrane protein [Lutibacter sp. A80]UMB59169.1 SusF/SusE family outer membrane protein [Lutibacter sp. A80]